LLGAIAFAGWAAGSAVAADLRVPPPVYKALPPPVPVWNWTGCYVGGHLGGGYARTENTNVLNTTVSAFYLPGQGYANDASGIVGGVQGGCNYQIGLAVFGIEGTYSGADISREYRTGFGGAAELSTNKLTALATFVARFGLALDNWLFYLKAGGADGRATLSVANIAPGGPTGDSHWHGGYTFGTGVEYAFTRNWIVGFEADYYRFETRTYEIGGAAGSYTFDSRPRDVYTFLGRLSYKFGGGPVAY